MSGTEEAAEASFVYQSTVPPGVLCLSPLLKQVQ